MFFLIHQNNTNSILQAFVQRKWPDKVKSMVWSEHYWASCNNQRVTFNSNKWNLVVLHKNTMLKNGVSNIYGIFRNFLIRKSKRDVSSMNSLTNDLVSLWQSNRTIAIKSSTYIWHNNSHLKRRKHMGEVSRGKCAEFILCNFSLSYLLCLIIHSFQLIEEVE